MHKYLPKLSLKFQKQIRNIFGVTAKIVSKRNNTLKLIDCSLDSFVIALGQGSGNFFNHYPKIFLCKLILPHGNIKKPSYYNVIIKIFTFYSQKFHFYPQKSHFYPNWGNLPRFPDRCCTCSSTFLLSRSGSC